MNVQELKKVKCDLVKKDNIKGTDVPKKIITGSEKQQKEKSELPHKVTIHNITPNIKKNEMKKSNLHYKLKKKIKEENVKNTHKLNNVGTLSASDKRFSCNICSYKSRWKGDLNKHLRTHTGEKPYSCNVCLYKCSNKSDLIIHLKRHNGEKSFLCNICSYKCCKKSNLQRHLKTHSDEKPFSCDTCLYKCSRRSSLKLHIIGMHSE